jgi:hypothetical protein
MRLRPRWVDDVVIDATEGSLGAHGYPNTDPDLSALFIASGAGIAPASSSDRSTTSMLRRRWQEILGVNAGDG